MPDPIKKSIYDSIPMRNKSIDTLKRKFKIGIDKVKDVEVYNPKTGKSKMIYNPGRSSVRNRKVND
tara:strand:+ start:2436 stop:2633 length:198 start_codon:yes stop_codon:yes gene_type:complete